MKGKVLHILSGDLWAGAEVQCFLQANALRDAGWEIEVLCFSEGKTAENFREGNFICHVIDEKLGFLHLLTQARKLIQQSGISLLAAHGYKENFLAAYLSRKLALPFIPTFHGQTEGYTGINGLKMLVYKRLNLLVSRYLSSKIIFVSKSLKASLGFENHTKAKVVYNVVSLPGNTYDFEARASNETAVCIAVGRLVPIKRLDIAIRAIHQLKERNISCNLQLVGSGPEEQNLRALVSKLSLEKEVSFLGFQTDALEIMNKANCLLITSDSEGIPSVLLEALSLNLPVVCTAVGGIPEVANLLKDYPIFLYGAGDVDGIASGIDKFCSGKVLGGDGNAREILETNFSPDVAAKRLSEIYDSVI
ncbi:hypothetical protein BVY02_01585 [bacterium J17]|nr:hypothetical protein BVY02_01585 [bacterium J17]